MHPSTEQRGCVITNANFNPYNPDALGVEWFADFEARPDIPSSGNLPGMTMVSRYTEVIKYGLPFVFRSGKGHWIMEVYDVDDIPAATLTTTTHLPSEDVRNIDAWGWGPFAPGGTQNNIYRALDSLTLTPGVWPNSGNPVDNNEFLFTIFGAGYEASFRFAGIIGTYTGKQIVAVNLWANVKEFIDFYQVTPMTIQPYIYVDGKRYFGESVTIEGETQQEVSANWTTNPATGAPWSVADVNKFDDAGGVYSGGWVVRPTGSSNNLATIMQGQLRITDAGPDPRVALGVLPTYPPQGKTREDGWVVVRLRTPAGGDWTKLIDKKYLFVIRRTVGQAGWLQWRYITQPGRAIPAGPSLKGTTVQLQADSFRPATPILEDVPDRGYGLLLRKSSGANRQSVDSQPYASLNDDGPGSLSVPPSFVTRRAFWTRVHLHNDATGEIDSFIEQEFTPSLTEQYQFVRVLCRLVRSDQGVLDADSIPRLVIRVFDRATDTQQGGTIFVYPSDLVPNRESFQEIGKQIPGAAPVLTAGVQYYFKITTAAQPSSTGSWAVQVLSAVPFQRNNPPPPNTGYATTGGLTDAYSLVGNDTPPPDYYRGRWTTQDACIVIHTLPEPITGFSGNASAPPVGQEACVTGDADDAVNYVQLAWDPSTLSVNEGGGFAYYEIQRDAQDGRGYQTIAKITSQSCGLAEDHEARIGCPVNYRMRVVRVDGAPSNWTAAETVTLTMNVGGFVFTSNFVPLRRIWYQDQNPRRFEFLANQVNKQFYGRDGSVTFNEIEDRLDRIPLELLVKTSEGRCVDPDEPSCPPIDVGRRVFDPLLVLSGNKKDQQTGQKVALPYIAMRDRIGNLWYVALSVTTGEINVEKVYTMSAVATEVTQVPSPFDRSCGSGSGSGSGEPMCQLIFDSFPDGSGSGDCFELGISTSGNEWMFASTPLDWCKIGGFAHPTSGSGSDPAFFSQFSINNFAAADYVENGSSGWALIVRGSSTSMVVLVVTAADICVYDVVAGVPTLLGCGIGTGGGVDGLNYRIEVVGNEVTVLENAISILGPLTTTIPSGTWTGMWDADSGGMPLPLFDNFASGCL